MSSALECSGEFQDGVRESDPLSLRQLWRSAVTPALAFNFVFLVHLARGRDRNLGRKGAAAKTREHVVRGALTGASRESEKV